MDATWADGQIVVEYYQACLAVLVWLLATFACLGILASVVLLFLECNPFTRSARRASEPASEVGAQGSKRPVRLASLPSPLAPPPAPHHSSAGPPRADLPARSAKDADQ